MPRNESAVASPLSPALTCLHPPLIPRLLTAVPTHAACSDNDGCAEGEFCKCAGMSDAGVPGTCTAFAEQGDSCGGFTACPVRCGPALTCQERQTADFEPRLMDAPGLCCPVLTACDACPPTHRNAYDVQGCKTCACEEKPCFGASPVTPNGGKFEAPIFCGRGPSHVDCPADTQCHIAANDKFAVCCPISAFPIEADNTVPPPLDGAVPGDMIPGGVRAADESTNEVLAAAQCGVLELNARSNGLYQQQLVRVVSATTQVVAGIRYQLEVETGESSACRNDGQQRELADCPVDGTVSRFMLAVVVQAWTETPCTLLDFTQIVDAEADETGSGLELVMGQEQGQDAESSSSSKTASAEKDEEDVYACIRTSTAGIAYCGAADVDPATNATNASAVANATASSNTTMDPDFPPGEFADAERNAACCQQFLHGYRGCHKRAKAPYWGMTRQQLMLVFGCLGSALVLLAFGCLVCRNRRRSAHYRLINGVKVTPIAATGAAPTASKTDKASSNYYENPTFRVLSFDSDKKPAGSDC